MDCRKISATHRRHHCWPVLSGWPMPCLRMKPQRRRQLASDTPSIAQINFRNCSRDWLGFLPKPLGVICFVLGTPLTFDFTFCDYRRIRQSIISRAQSSRRQNVNECAAGFFTVQKQACSPVAQCQPRLVAAAFGLANWTGCDAKAAMPAPTQCQG